MVNSAIENPQSAIPAYSPWREFVTYFKKNRLAVAGLVVVLTFFVISALFWAFALARFNWPYDPDATNLADRLAAPSFRHPLGTDHVGRDLLSRMLHGARVSLSVGFVAVAVAMTIGILIGSVAGYVGGLTDTVLMRFVDIMMCFPSFFLILTVVALLGPNIWNVMLVIGLTGWTGTARFVRAEFLTLRERDFAVAAQALGARPGRIIFRHILPNALAPVLVSATLGIAGAILTEAGLSFLGLGVPPPTATWGNIITEGRTYIMDAPWLVGVPGVAILVTVLAFNLCGEGIRDALDPRLRL